MPVQVSHPGVYIQELPSAVHPIVGLGTSSTAFVDVFKRGPAGKPVRIDSMADFTRTFGGVWDESESSYAISQFFLNGGYTAWVLRLEPVAARTASLTLIVSGGTLGAFFVVTLSATSPGVWGNSLQFARFESSADGVDGDGAVTSFGLSIHECATVRGKHVVLQSELFHELSLGDGDRDVVEILAHESMLACVTQKVACADSDAVVAALVSADANPKEVDKLLKSDVFQPGGALFAVWPPVEPIEGAPAVGPTAKNVKSTNVVDRLLHVPLSGGSDGVTKQDRETAFASLSAQYDQDLTAFQAYQAAVAKAVKDKKEPPTPAIEEPTAPNPVSAALADDIALLMTDEITGISVLKTMEPERFNLLCLPATFKMNNTNRGTVYEAAHKFCEDERAFYLVDGAPQRSGEVFREDYDYSGKLQSNAAVYFPHLTMADSLRNNRPRPVGPSGTVAGVIARTDTDRGVWKAPAGTDATLRGAEVGVKVTDAENGVLNQLGINVLRNFPVYGNVVWGARTTDGADFEANQWKYIPVRRLALHIENSLWQGTQWVVFEPNDEPLWGQIRLNIGTFMHDLFRQGAFQGQTPGEAYFVRCDKTTTTQSDIDKGIVNIVVGFAPLKPAEFVIISIQQIHPE